jgi:hypothetical protein
MKGNLTVLLVTLASAALLVAVVPVPAATGTIPYRWQNCKHVNAKYRHGVGKRYAHDRTSGTPVTNFYRSTRLYNIAMSYNRGLDGDRDGIACERH